jgi:undecaprenyl-phosphate glucose phosphotransferase
MVRPGMDTIGAEGTVGSGVAASGFRPRGRWRLMNGHDHSVRGPTSTSVHSASPRVVLVGKRRDTRRLIRRLGDHPWSGPTVVGYVDLGHGPGATLRPHHRHLVLHPETDPVPVLGSIDHLDQLVDRARATHVVVAVSGKPGRLARPLEAQLINSDVAVHWVFLDSGRPDLGALANPSGAGLHSVDTANRPSALPWFFAEGGLDWPRLAKRLLDMVIATLALLLLTPLFVVVAIAIWLTSGRPIFYTQDRIGQGGRLFKIIKFRSMRLDAESETGPIWASDHDTRCTRIGDWLRHANIDELPQLLNVLKGDMSLVGPRPERPTFVDEFRVTVPDYNLRHAVPGGMTGWAQVHGWRGRTSLRKRLQYDLDYIQRWSVALDLRILLMTVQHVFWGKTSWKDSNRPLKAPH